MRLPDLFAAGVPQALVLLALRVTGLLLVAPVFSARTIPARLRTALLLLLTLLLAPVALAGVREAAPLAAGSLAASSLAAGALAAVAVTPASFVVELLVGLAIGLGAALLVGAVETAGDLMTTTIGLSGSALLDPLSGGQSAVLGHFCGLFATTVLLALDGHLVMLDALGASLRAVPVGSGMDVGAGLRALVAEGATLFLLGLRFAAPVIAATLIGNVALAILTRVAPQLNVLSIAFPIQISLGLVAFVGALAFIATWMTGWAAQLDGMIGPVVHALRPR